MSTQFRYVDSANGTLGQSGLGLVYTGRQGKPAGFSDQRARR